MIVETKDGIRKWTGKYWVYYTKYKCDFCDKEITICKRTNINSKNKRKHTFCCSECKHQFYTRERDYKQYTILEKQNEIDFYYLIGLIASDGHIKWPGCTKSIKNYSCSIELNSDDVYLLENISQKFGGSISPITNKSSYTWNICNRKYIEYLRDTVGMTNNKSLNLNVSKWFNQLLPSQQTAFLHGVFDGDGSIYFVKKNNIWGANISSRSPDFIHMIYNFFKNQGYNVKLSKTNIHFNGSYMIEPLKQILSDKKIHLKRKYLKFIEAQEHYKQCHA
jgi:uncharacterized protein YlaI